MATIFGLCRPSSSQDIYKNLNAGSYNELTNNTLYIPAFNFYKYLGLTMACKGLKQQPIFKLINHKIVVFDEVNILFHFNNIQLNIYCCFIVVILFFFLRVLRLSDTIFKLNCCRTCKCSLKKRMSIFVCPCTKFHELSSNISSLFASRLRFRSI